MLLIDCDPALGPYEALAPHYDAFTAGYDHERWLGELERLARRHGLTGSRALDVACGTGKSFLPLLRRGYSVTACDSSPAMVTRAREAAPAGTPVLEADLRSMPFLGEFDLVTCLDDVVNHLLTEADLTAAFGGIARNLAPDGVLVFDANTVRTYRTAFCSDRAIEADGVFLCWRAGGLQESEGALLAEASVEIFARGEYAGWERSRSHHVQRHWSGEALAEAAAEAGLELFASVGQSTGARIDPDADEDRHTKTVHLARPARERAPAHHDDGRCAVGIIEP
jgi:SAM-dependent methyltransferase